LNEGNTAQDHCAYDPLSKIGFCDQQGSNVIGWNNERFDVAFGVHIDERRAVPELAHLTNELAGALFQERADVAQAVALGEGHVAGQQHEHTWTGLSGLDESLAIYIPPHSSEPTEAIDVIGRECRERLIIARSFGNGRRIRRPVVRGR
jgi:hypothetical protein